MSEDDVERLLSSVVEFMDERGKGEWLEHDPTYEKFREVFFSWGDPFYTRERNYN
jgi:hypothetical protein